MSTASQGQAAALAGAVPKLELLSGKNKGQSVTIDAVNFSIGRGENNDLVLPSESVSRYHAVIEKKEDGSFVIRDNQSKNGVLINGNNVPEGVLKDGDEVQLGHYIFQFQVPAVQSAAPSRSVPVEIPQMEFGMAQNEGVNAPVAKKPRNNRPIIYGLGALLLIGALYYSKNSDTGTATEDGAEPTAKKADAATPAPSFEAPVKEQKLAAVQDPTLTAAEQETGKTDFTNSAVKESEQYFRKGQREYLNKNYHRAIEAFRSALALQKGHPLADYYLRLAVYEVELEAKKNWEIAGKYFQSMQYQRAIYHYTEVINLMQHRPSDKMVDSAEKYILQCKRRLQAAELFP